MKLLLLSQTNGLYHSLQSSGRFEIQKVNGSQIDESNEIIVVDGNGVDIQEFKDMYDSIPADMRKFYVMPDFMMRSNIGTFKQTFPDVFFLPPRMTPNQITEQIILTSHEDVVRPDRNIHVFFGADSKVGTTMIAQSTAELIAQNTDVNVGLLLLGNHTSSFIDIKEESVGLESIKIKLFNNILSKEDIVKASVKIKGLSNLLVIPGPKNIQDLRIYQPEHAERLIMLASQCVDVLIVDAGCEVERGLSLGALRMTSNKFLVTTQQQHAKERFLLQDDQVFNPLQIEKKQFYCIINKYVDGGITEKQISSIYNMAVISKIPYLDVTGWQAELEQKSLLHYNEAAYAEGIEVSAQYICEIQQITFREGSKKKFRWWFGR